MAEALTSPHSPWRFLPWSHVPLVSWACSGFLFGAVLPFWSTVPWWSTWLAIITWCICLWQWAVIPHILHVVVLIAVAAMAGGQLHTPLPHQEQLVQLEGSCVRARNSVYGQWISLKVAQPQHWSGHRISIQAPVTPSVRAGDSVRCSGRFYVKDGFPRLRASQVEIQRWREDGPQAWAWRALEHGPQRQGLASLLLLGRGWSDERDHFRDAGLMHLLAVSGLHLGLALGAVLLGLRILAVPWGWQQGLLVVTALTYVWLTGGQSATWRATCMALVWSCAALSGRHIHGLSLVLLAATMLVLWDPVEVHRLGFQLSVIAVAGIVTLGRQLIRLHRYYLPVQPWPLDRLFWRLLLWSGRFCADALAIGIAASLAVLPLIAYHFQVMYPWSALSSVFMGAILALTLSLGLAWLLLAGVWLAGPWQGLLWGFDHGLSALVAGARWSADWPGAALQVSPPPWWFALLWPALFVPLRDYWDLPTRSAAALILIGYLYYLPVPL